MELVTSISWVKVRHEKLPILRRIVFARTSVSKDRCLPQIARRTESLNALTRINIKLIRCRHYWIECDSSGCYEKRSFYRLYMNSPRNTRWFKYDRDDLCVNKSQFVPVIFEPPFISVNGLERHFTYCTYSVFPPVNIMRKTIGL